MFNRRVRDAEEGRSGRGRTAIAKPARPDVERGVVVHDRASDEAVTALFQGLAERTGHAPAMDLDTFRGYLDRQLGQIRQKTGCEAVQFRLVTEEGKVKLKARPVGRVAG